MATVEPHRVRSGRGTELGLLVLALAIGVGAYALVGIGTSGAVPPDVLGYGAGLAGLALGLHLVLRWRAPFADPVILPTTVALNGVGLAMIYRIDVAYRAKEGHELFAAKQLLWTTIGVGLAALVLILLRDHRTLRRYTYTAMVVALVLLALPLVPGIGTSIYGARIWIRVGAFSMQPAEFAKLALAVFFAGYLVTHRDTLALAGSRFAGLQLPRARDLGPILVVWAGSIGVLIFQRDLGTSLLLFGLFVAMLYLATERLSWVVIGLLMFAGGAALAASVFSHVAARFDVWLNAMDPDVYDRFVGGSGQLVRGLFGMASGGLFGTGWGEGRPDLVTFAESDFIVASLGEELGLTGLIALLMLYVILTQRGMRAAVGSPRRCRCVSRTPRPSATSPASSATSGTARACSSVTGGTTRARSTSRTRSATGSRTRRSRTTRSRSRSTARVPTSGSRSACGSRTPVRVRAPRSCRCTCATRRRPCCDPCASSRRSGRSRSSPASRAKSSSSSRRATCRTGTPACAAGSWRAVRSSSRSVRRRATCARASRSTSRASRCGAS